MVIDLHAGEEGGGRHQDLHRPTGGGGVDLGSHGGRSGPSTCSLHWSSTPSPGARARSSGGACGMEVCAVLGRGFNQATAFEWALKLQELTQVVAQPSRPPISSTARSLSSSPVIRCSCRGSWPGDRRCRRRCWIDAARPAHPWWSSAMTGGWQTWPRSCSSSIPSRRVAVPDPSRGPGPVVRLPPHVAKGLDPEQPRVCTRSPGRHSPFGSPLGQDHPRPSRTFSPRPGWVPRIPIRARRARVAGKLVDHFG